MNPYESPAEIEECRMEFDLGKLAFALLAIMFVALIPIVGLSAWIGFRPERFAEYMIAIPLITFLIVVGFTICVAGASGKLERNK